MLYVNYYGEYFDWLCDKINLKPGTYDILIRTLYNLEFIWVVDLDFNRSEDGKLLRGDFYNDEFNTPEKMDAKPCSVLEALIALAGKMNYILDDEDRGDRTRIWFWEMIDNLKLMRFKDEKFNDPVDPRTEQEIVDICNRWMNRKISYDGTGSPFPLWHPHRDQRKLQLIDQMNDYVLEHYVVNDEIL